MKISKRTSLKRLAPHKWAMLASFLLVSLFYALNTFVAPGWASWLASIPALIIVFVTAIARLDTISQDKVNLNWQMKRTGFVLIASLAVVYGYIPFSNQPLFPTWLLTGLMWGFALTWLATPNQPPWWKFVTGEYRLRKPTK